MPKALPVTYGDGRHIGDIRLQAQKFTSRCLAIMGAAIENDEIDIRVRFTIMKFLIELGWGRPRAMAAPEAPDRTTISLDGQLEKILQTLMERNPDDDDNLDRDDEGGCLLPAPDGRSLAEHGPAQPENP